MHAATGSNIQSLFLLVNVKVADEAVTLLLLQFNQDGRVIFDEN